MQTLAARTRACSSSSLGKVSAGLALGGEAVLMAGCAVYLLLFRRVAVRLRAGRDPERGQMVYGFRRKRQRSLDAAPQRSLRSRADLGPQTVESITA